MSKTFVIMEAAACHDGNYVEALRLVDLAASIGADACKFQWCSLPQRLAARRNAPELADSYQLLRFPQWWLGSLGSACSDAGIELMVTTYLPEDVAVVAPHVRRFKVSSFESQDAHFVALHAEWPEKPLVLSAGMAGDVKESVGLYQQLAEIRWRRKYPGGQEYRYWDYISVLHCVSAYPCPDDQAALARLRPDAWRHQNFAGYSDHTRHPWTGALAVAAGARVVEFHARLDDTDPANPDYAVARTPAEAREYVANIRAAEALYGDGESRVMPAEEASLRYRVGA